MLPTALAQLRRHVGAVGDGGGDQRRVGDAALDVLRLRRGRATDRQQPHPDRLGIVVVDGRQTQRQIRIHFEQDFAVGVRSCVRKSAVRVVHVLHEPIDVGPGAVGVELGAPPVLVDANMPAGERSAIDGDKVDGPRHGLVKDLCAVFNPILPGEVHPCALGRAAGDCQVLVQRPKLLLCHDFVAILFAPYPPSSTPTIYHAQFLVGVIVAVS
ncbi:hypothetical protein PG985_003152 [Apiospora marii]|uniref:uncharacterized protein n=1 Tax=Apiospora marii TaxID=335849 RepID=UPI00312E0142